MIVTWDGDADKITYICTHRRTTAHSVHSLPSPPLQCKVLTHWVSKYSLLMIFFANEKAGTSRSFVAPTVSDTTTCPLVPFEMEVYLRLLSTAAALGSGSE